MGVIPSIPSACIVSPKSKDMKQFLNKQMKRKINQVLDLLWARKNVQGQWESERIDKLETIIIRLAEDLGFEVEIWEGTIRKIKD